MAGGYAGAGDATLMKRGTPRHPKVYDLAQALGLPVRSRAVVIGHLELLWHFTSEFAPQGDVGKFSDDRLEAAMDWTGKRGKLVEALTTAKWLDVHDQCRLVVHDWHDHADDATKKKLIRLHLHFLSVTGKVTGQSSPGVPTTADKIRLPLPLPLPLPGPWPEPAAWTPQRAPLQQRKVTPIVESNGDLEDWFEARYRRHPKKRDRGIAMNYISQVEGVEDPEWRVEFERVHELWISTSAWGDKGGAYAPTFAQWILDQGWKYEPPEEKTELARMMDAI